MGNAATVKEPVSEPQTSQHAEGLGKLYASPAFHNKKSCCYSCIKIFYVILSVVNILQSIALMAIAVSAAIAMKIFSSEQSGRLVALILIAVIAAITLSITIYAMVAVLRNHYKHVQTASVVLFILAIILSIVVGVSMKISEEDEVKLSRSLSESFRLSREDNPRHVKLWAAIQNDLTCCGVYSAEDYRNKNLPEIFPPDVPISCCPGYDPDRSQFVQEREREACKAKREYYEMGCRNPVIELFREMAKRVVTITIIIIIIMIWISILGTVWTLFCKKRGKKSKESQRSPSVNVPMPELYPKQQMSTKT